ncbi:hypothetical protein MNBD_GAMMA12-2928 [hydrothermal vent metagenome]|uniref:Uncharacterized protein n=1 Tax=hydrothermal vent metagenome TaxID=652676 RepID=A0A3B0YF82_9ZZZZ
MRIRGVIISYVGDKWHKSKKIVSLIDEKVFSNKYLGNTMLICGVVAMGVTVYDLATTEDKDVFWTMRVLETVLGSAKLVGQLHISFTTISDKVLREVLDAQRMSKKGVIAPKTNAKGKVLLGKHTADTIGDKMAKIAKLAKTLAVLGVVIEILVTTRLVLQITTDTDGREFRNSYLTKAAVIGVIGVVGSALLTVQLFWWGVASISLGVPVIGWILTILAICAAVWMYFTQKSELQSHEYWVRHCIWGRLKYEDKNIWPYKNKKITARKKKIKLSQAEVYINYSNMEKSLAHELAEINQILNDFYVKVYWTPGSNVYHSRDQYIYMNGQNNFSYKPKNKDDRPLYINRVSLVIDVIVPSWNKKMHSDLGISVTGIMKLRTSAMYQLDPELNPYQGEKYQEKREFISRSSKNVSKRNFDYIPAEPHYINPKPKESMGKFTTIRYRIDGFQVHRDYVRKFEIDVRFYPGPTYKIVYPNINGVHIDIDENETNSTTKSMVMDGRLAPIEEKFVSSYLFQKQNKKSE